MCFIFQAVKPIRREVQPEVSDVEGTDIESATTTSDDTDVQEEAPQVKGAPKIIGRLAINDKVDNVPVFNVFLQVFIFDGRRFQAAGGVEGEHETGGAPPVRD